MMKNLIISSCKLSLLFFMLMPPPVIKAENEIVSPALSSSTAAEKRSGEPLVVALYLNGRAAGEHVIYCREHEYWIPYGLFVAESGLHEEKQEPDLSRFNTSLGRLTFIAGELKVFEEIPCISFASLKRVFLVNAEFDSSQFSITLDIPWVPSATDKAMPRPLPVADVRAPTGSLSFLEVDAGVHQDFHASTKSTLRVETGGRLIDGVWDMTLEGDPQQQMELRRCHWTAFSEHLALRIGTGTDDISPLLDNIAFGGLQLGWNNHKILNHLDFSSGSGTDSFVSLDRTQQRTIEGDGPPAGIAELRFDGRVAARQRIRLDGRFFFENVRMATDLRKTEVYLYLRSIEEKPFAMLDFTQSVFNRSLPAGELLLLGALGQSGNPLSAGGYGSGHRMATGAGHVQYGVNNRITLEAGGRYNPETRSDELYAGTVISVRSNWVAALYGAHANNHYGSDLRLEGRGKTWNLSYWSTRSDAEFCSASRKKSTEQWLRVSAKPFVQSSLLLFGRESTVNGREIRKFLLPGICLAPFSAISLSCIPDDDEAYRCECALKVSSTSDLHLVYEKKIASAEFSQKLGRSFRTRVFNDYSAEGGRCVNGLYLDVYVRNSRYDQLEFGLSHSGGAVGVSGSWNRYVNTGLRFAVQYSYNMNNARDFVTTTNDIMPVIPAEAGHFLGCSISWDLGYSSRRLHPINRSAISTTRGGLAGSFNLTGSTRLKASDINEVGILINGVALDQRQIDGSFFVGNLRPGIYTVAVDTERLPIELSVGKKEMTVEVKNGAVSSLTIPVHPEFGVAGRLLGADSQGIEGMQMVIVDLNNNPVATALTDTFGFYRAEGLRPGGYLLKVLSADGHSYEEGLQQSFTVIDDYLFDVNMTVTASSEAARTPFTSESDKEKNALDTQRQGAERLKPL